MMKNNCSKHGGNLDQAARVYGVRREELLDYSANLNPLGLPPGLSEFLQTRIFELVNYPDPDCLELKTVLASFLKVKTEQIIIGNGAVELIYLLFRVLCPRKVMLIAPTFTEYADAALQVGAEVEYFELQEAEDFRLNLLRLINELSDQVELLMFCNPNNPTSTLISQDELLELLAVALRKGIMVVIDEAFIELTVGGVRNSLIESLANYENLFLIRSLTKIFAVPGLRIGYGLGRSALIEQMWKLKLPWSVNSLALSVGEFLLTQTEYLAQTEVWLREELSWFCKKLMEYSQFRVFEPQSNFILIKLLRPELTSEILKKSLADRGILIRDAANFQFLDVRFIRVAVRSRSENERLLEVLREIFF